MKAITVTPGDVQHQRTLSLADQMLDVLAGHTMDDAANAIGVLIAIAAKQHDCPKSFLEQTALSSQENLLAMLEAEASS